MLEECFDTDVLDYFPIRDGLKASSIGLRKLPKDKLKDPRNFIFQIDEFFAHYRKNKIECRKEKLCKYYQVVAPAPQELIQFFLDTLLDEYPQSFKLTRLEKNWQFECLLSKETLVFDEKLNLLEAQSKYERDEVGGPYVDAWDALSMQVSEDLVLQKVPGNERDFTQVIHLCHANGWSAEGAVGQSFDKIHEDVPGINKLIPDSRKILSAILRSEHTMERVGALQYRTSGELNRHPQISRADLNQDFDLEKNANVFLRFERQTVTAFPNSKAFLFTIRTYLTHMKQKGRKDWKWEAFKGTLKDERPEVKTFAFLERYRAELEKWVRLVEVD